MKDYCKHLVNYNDRVSVIVERYRGCNGGRNIKYHAHDRAQIETHEDGCDEVGEEPRKQMNNVDMSH